MNCILFDPSDERKGLLPFTFTRPVANIRIGILTIDEKWRIRLGLESISYLTQPYLQSKFKLVTKTQNLLINGSILPTDQLVKEVASLQPDEALFDNEILIAACISEANLQNFKPDEWLGSRKQTESQAHIQLKHTYDIFSQNGIALEEDFKLLTDGRVSEPIPEGNQVVNLERIFIEPGAKVYFSILNASTGPIYIGKNAEVMEGCKIRGPFALCEDAGLKMDAKIYGPTTVGPHCKVGGEVNNTVFFSYSNKGHDGFVGNSVIGEWVNMGADTNNSNLKNTYEEVKLWNYSSSKFEKTGLTFCGLMMADHAKCGINTMFNTGTVVDVGANVFGSGFPRNFVPAFSWGGTQGFETYQLNKFFVMAAAMCKRRHVDFDETEKAIIQHVFELTKQYRHWE